ncbi:hypothetical protein [Alkalibacillus almallahensis]|uniref:hypothetical protein n=1 Tax=Alkalibacillus almallahensis TaxID=1379154 RepID=UPI00141EE5B0|nr:hypothetical protein [Alkalibacillus almallahensis]NIK12753.1 DNA-binding LytR/AlgR family response regulator [Alkalibacillus almallahensis]
MKQIKFILFASILFLGGIMINNQVEANSNQEEYLEKVQDAKETHEKISNSNFVNEINLELQKRDVKASVATIEVFSSDDKTVKIKSSKVTQENIEKIVKQIATENNLGIFNIEVIRG